MNWKAPAFSLVALLCLCGCGRSGAEVVRMVRESVLDPSLAKDVRRIPPRLQEDHVPLHVI